MGSEEKLRPMVYPPQQQNANAVVHYTRIGQTGWTETLCGHQVTPAWKPTLAKKPTCQWCRRKLEQRGSATHQPRTPGEGEESHDCPTKDFEVVEGWVAARAWNVEWTPPASLWEVWADGSEEEGDVAVLLIEDTLEAR